MTERGSITILASTMVGLVLAGAVLAVAATGLVSARFTAQTAADAAALAAAPLTYVNALTFVNAFGLDPTAEARRFAALNGATLIECRCDVDARPILRSVRVEVVVVRTLPLVGVVEITAVARAEYEPP